jgi:hypothetical protein
MSSARCKTPLLRRRYGVNSSLTTHPYRFAIEKANASDCIQIMEPNKCLGWVWKTWDELKEMQGSSEAGNVLFLPLQNLLAQKPNFEDLRPKNQPQRQR